MQLVATLVGVVVVDRVARRAVLIQASIQVSCAGAAMCCAVLRCAALCCAVLCSHSLSQAALCHAVLCSALHLLLCYAAVVFA